MASQPKSSQADIECENPTLSYRNHHTYEINEYGLLCCVCEISKNDLVLDFISLFSCFCFRFSLIDDLWTLNPCVSGFVCACVWWVMRLNVYALSALWLDLKIIYLLILYSFISVACRLDSTTSQKRCSYKRHDSLQNITWKLRI